MTTAGEKLPDRPAGAGAARPRARRLWLLFAVAVVVGAVLVAPYMLLDIDSSRLEVQSRAHYTVLVVHVFAATVALVLGPLQFIPQIRARRRAHRMIGRGYLAVGVLPAAVTAVPVAVLSGRLITQVGLILPALGWLVTGWLALRAARRRDFAAHRAWMMRNYALTFLAVTARLLVPFMLLTQMAFGGATGDRADAVQSLVPYGQILGWIVNLLVVEVLLRRQRR